MGIDKCFGIQAFQGLKWNNNNFNVVCVLTSLITITSGPSYVSDADDSKVKIHEMSQMEGGMALPDALRLWAHSGMLDIINNYPFSPVELLDLATVSKGICSTISPLISKHFIFFWAHAHQFQYYSPTNLKYPSDTSHQWSFKGLPPSTTYIHFIPTLPRDCELINIPPQITHLTFGEKFNSLVDNLPDSILYLEFMGCFNQPVDNLPSQLQTLRNHSPYFDQPIDNLPSTLKHLYVAYIEAQMHGHSFDHLPSNLESLEISMRGQHLDHLPSTLQHLQVLFYSQGCFMDHLPHSLTHIKLGGSFDHPIDHLPGNTIKLDIWGSFNHPIDYLPSKLESLRLSSQAFHQSLDNLPSSLTSLSIESFKAYPFSVDNLPKLTHLKLGGNYYGNSFDHLPNSLRYLTYSSFDGDKNFYLPPSIEVLIVNSTRKHGWVTKY